jgi:hypothetical protein
MFVVTSGRTERIADKLAAAETLRHELSAPNTAAVPTGPRRIVWVPGRVERCHSALITQRSQVHVSLPLVIVALMEVVAAVGVLAK